MITHVKDPNSDKHIVFIHGIAGGKGTWRKFSKYLERKWNYEYGFLLKYFLYYKNILDNETILEKFNSRFLRICLNIALFVPSLFNFLIKVLWSKRNNHNVNLLENYIEINCKESKNIVLVAHSMGGLIARQFLINYRKNNHEISRFKMLITFATPHKGSKVANYISIRSYKSINYFYKKISTFFNYRISPQVGDLNSINDFIQSIDKAWTDFDLERRIVFIRVVAKKDLLVTKESAMLHNNDIENIHPFEYGHSGLINPSLKANEFGPIDVFIESLDKLKFEDDVLEEETETDENDDSENVDSY